MTGTRVSTRHDSEGPSHDPYAWDEITVERQGRSATFRTGLGCWVELRYGDGKTITVSEHQVVNGVSDLARLFESVMGASPSDFEHWHEIARNRCPDCGSSRYVGELGHGYAGESMYGCTRCGIVLYDNFYMEMIE